MAIPVNKPTLDKTINDNILLNNNTQFITAKKLQDTLYPIVNSTFGMKTIWAGKVYSDFFNTRVNWEIYENYYDPNYFPPIQELNSITNGPLNKYQVTFLGSGLLADNGTNTGTFTNITTSYEPTVSSKLKQGQGLTFNGTISGGVLTSLTVNNPGCVKFKQNSRRASSYNKI
jgi:hypothetical protein